MACAEIHVLQTGDVCAVLLFYFISCYVLLCLQSEAPLMIRPLLGDMTRSEIHAVMTGGFATIAGSVLAAYILMGVCSVTMLLKNIYVLR